MKPVVVIGLCAAALALSACKLPHLKSHRPSAADVKPACDCEPAKAEQPGPPPGQGPEQTVFADATTPAPAAPAAASPAPEPSAADAAPRAEHPRSAARHARTGLVYGHGTRRWDTEASFAEDALVAGPPQLPPPPPAPPPYGVAAEDYSQSYGYAQSYGSARSYGNAQSYGYAAAAPGPYDEPPAYGAAYDGGDNGRSRPWRWYSRP